MKQTAVIITGGIGSGKSVVSRICRLKGYRVIDTDLLARHLMDSNADLCRAIARRWGEKALTADGKPERGIIGNIVFADKEELNWLNSLVHWLVRDYIAAESEKHQGNEPLFVECAIPVTARLVGMCSQIWLVTAPEEERIRRVKMRNPNLSEEHIRQRIEAQKSEYDDLPEEMRTTIVNDGIAPVLPQIINILT